MSPKPNQQTKRKEEDNGMFREWQSSSAREGTVRVCICASPCVHICVCTCERVWRTGEVCGGTATQEADKA